MANSVDPDQTAPDLGLLCLGGTIFLNNKNEQDIFPIKQIFILAN